MSTDKRVAVFPVPEAALGLGLGLGLVVLTAEYETIEVGTKSGTCLKVIGDWTLGLGL